MEAGVEGFLRGAGRPEVVRGPHPAVVGVEPRTGRGVGLGGSGVKASPRDFRGAFSFLRSPGRRGLGGELVEGLMNLFQPTVNGQLPPGDMRFVRKLDDFVVKNKIATAAPDRDP
eukprot:scaffold435_cov342-Pavlova_lutheri.AAC.33